MLVKFGKEDVQCKDLKAFWKLPQVVELLSRSDLLSLRQIQHKDYLHTELWATTFKDGQILVANVINEDEIQSLDLSPFPEIKKK